MSPETLDKAIITLERFKIEIFHIADSYDFTSWKNRTVNIIRRIYGPASEPEKQLKAMKYMSFFGDDNNLAELKNQTTHFTQSIIDELQEFGVPETPKKESQDKLHINITQTQHQEAKVSIDIVLSAIQDELTGKQLKEVQEVIEQDAPVEEKKSKIMEKLSSFGSDVASNIVASLLTNPQLFGV